MWKPSSARRAEKPPHPRPRRGSSSTAAPTLRHPPSSSSSHRSRARAGSFGVWSAALCAAHLLDEAGILDAAGRLVAGLALHDLLR